jgi:PAS domain S-box-containing protein
MMTAPPATHTGGWAAFPAPVGDDPAANAAGFTILDALDVPVVVVQRDSSVACFNKAAAAVLGVVPADIARPARDLPVLAGSSRLERRCREVIAGGVESHVDLPYGDKWFVVRISPWRRSDRGVAGTVLTFTDVTAFRASIQNAVYERECTKAILNTVGDPLVVLGTDHRIQSGNRAFYAMFGVSREQTHGAPLYQLGNGAFEAAGFPAQLQEMSAGNHAFGPVEVDGVVTPRGRRALLLDAHPLSFPGHSERRVLVTFQDITARKQAEAAKDLRSEEELRRSEASLAEGQRLSLTGSFSWKVATDEITWSEQLYRIYGFEIGVPVTIELIRTRVHPDDSPLIEMMKRARKGTSDFEWQYRLVMPDHSIKYLHAVAHATRDQGGELEYVAAVQDVTARRASEEALTKARSELARVARVTSLGVLTASIAHEVNQPLSGVITNAGTGLRMLDADPPNVEGARETVRRTIRDGNRASDVISRLRALFTKEGEFTLESLDLNEVTREVMALCLSDLQRNRVAVQAKLAEDLPTITGDRIQLQQVILNLLRNASDAMIDVHDRPRQLLIMTEREDADRVRVAVRDAGVGVDPESMSKLLDAFYTTKSDGMGIGLSVSRSIVERHDGRLWAEPNDGPGTTFSFSIPSNFERAADPAPG